MDDEYNEIRANMLQNDKYPEPSSATEMLSATLVQTKALNTAGFGAMFDAAALMSAKSMLVLGIETVTITYCLYQLTVVIPRSESVFQRKRDVEQLRTAASDKGVSLGASLEALATKLSTQIRAAGA